jgi:predicted transcriptional regulator
MRLWQDVLMDERIYPELQALIVKSGMTKTAAAKKLGITSQHFWNVCAGKTRPSEELYARMKAFRDKLKSSGLLEIA